MRTLLIGFVVFCLWAWFASYMYVNKIFTIPIPEATVTDPSVVTDTLRTDTLTEQVSKPQEQILPAEIAKEQVTYFDFDRSVIKSKPELKDWETLIQPYLERNSDLTVTIVGHTDATGTDDYNYSLGLRRARAVMQFFENQGIPAAKMIVSSKGETEPVVDNTTKEGRAKNRRAVITIK